MDQMAGRNPWSSRKWHGTCGKRFMTISHKLDGGSPFPRFVKVSWPINITTAASADLPSAKLRVSGALHHFCSPPLASKVCGGLNSRCLRKSSSCTSVVTRVRHVATRRRRRPSESIGLVKPGQMCRSTRRRRRTFEKPAGTQRGRASVVSYRLGREFCCRSSR